MRANNYFDGPFDQLPDNFIEGETLRDAILAVRPQLKGEIDRFGGAPDGSIRFMIGPVSAVPGGDAISIPIHACAREETEAAGLLSLLCHRRQIRWYGGAASRRRAARQK